MDKLLEEFIKDWRLKNNTKDAIYSSYHYDAMAEFAKEYHKEQLLINDVGSNKVVFKDKEIPNFNEWVKTMFVKNEDLYKMFKSSDVIEIYNKMFMIREREGRGQDTTKRLMM